MTSVALPEVLVGPVAGRKPRFEWRGLLIDSARTRYSVEVMLQVIDLAARYGFNRLHWHLTDDQGWRFEVPGYPLLTEVGGVLPRPEYADYDSLLGDTREQAIAESASKWTHGFYTDDEIRRVVAHAESRGIVIVPEVDLPGHMATAIRAYPHLGRPEGLPLPTESMREHMWWPARNDLLWPTDEAEQFVRAVVRHVTELFPGKLVHIGGDECAYRQWSSDPAMSQILAGLGLSRIEEVQTWFMEIATSELRAAARQVAVWDEACDIWDNDGILVVMWDEERGIERITNSRHPYVFADARTLYLNRIDPAAAGQKGMVPGISVRDILTDPWEATNNERCVGIQACAWSEFMLDGEDLMSMLMPRLMAVAERQWNPHVDVDEAAARITREYETLVAHGVIADPT